MKSLVQFCVLILFFGSVLPCTAAPSLIDHYRKALDTDPQNQMLRYHLGIALLNQGETLLAVKAFREAYPQRASDPEINFNLAIAYTRLKDPDSALIYLDQALATGAVGQPEIYPLNTAYYNLVVLYEHLGQLDAAVFLLQRLFSENPEHFDYLRMLGDYHLRLGQVDSAMLLFDDYLKKVPEDNEAREYVYAAIFNRALFAYEKHEFERARQDFSSALRFAKNSLTPLYYLTLLDYQQEKYQQVVERLPPIYSGLNDDLKNTARSILYNTALSFKQQKDFIRAQQALKPLTSSTNPRTKDLALLAGIQLQTGAYALARQNYVLTLQGDPGNGSAAQGIQAAEKGAFNENIQAAGAAFAAENLSAVRKYLLQAAEIYPKDNRLRIYQARLVRVSKSRWLSLQEHAKVLEDKQQYAEALVLLRQGLTLAPEEPQLLRHEKRLVVLLSDRIDNLYRQGREYYSRSELRLARVSFEQLDVLSPDHPDGKKFLNKIDRELQQEAQRAVGAAEASMAQDNLIAAKQHFVRALIAWPEELVAKEGLAQAERMLTARAAETLVRARRARADRHLKVALELLEEGFQKWPSATIVSELAQVRSEMTQRQNNIAQLVRTAIQQQQFNKAAQLLAQADRLDSGLIVFVELRADLKLARELEVEHALELARQDVAAGIFDSGLKAYRRVIEIDPGNTEALAGLKRGQYELNTTISQLLTDGSIAHKNGRFEQARQAYRSVLSLDPYQTEALNALRQVERVGRSGLTSADSNRIYLEGISYYTEGDYKQAIAAWWQVLDLDPAHEKAKMNIDKAERKLSQIRERQGG